MTNKLDFLFNIEKFKQFNKILIYDLDDSSSQFYSLILKDLLSDQGFSFDNNSSGPSLFSDSTFIETVFIKNKKTLTNKIQEKGYSIIFCPYFLGKIYNKDYAFIDAYKFDYHLQSYLRLKMGSQGINQELFTAIKTDPALVISEFDKFLINPKEYCFSFKNDQGQSSINYKNFYSSLLKPNIKNIYKIIKDELQNRKFNF